MMVNNALNYRIYLEQLNKERDFPARFMWP